ncbi:DUF2071 domain-containing protein [Gimesia aquarii]|uniref:DUF2071 domain-containing protein n=1 Tax=Gimesia aquarii TaxID=2527964 RepID=A0A517VZT1_9PLAN|nr:DUF2071 domain-containing protein [Gimesia aquarii]QDT98514.1 hypothetical protein V144x_40200 [Gimesia aquarii]
MRIPVIEGIIDRRILANYRIDPDVMARVLPAPFRPKLIHGSAIGGVCLIRLKNVRPRFLPFSGGTRSENAAHRFAVEWDSDGQTHEGVYVNRRDTDSCLNALAGGRIFPGTHHHAAFTVEESEDHFSVEMQSKDGEAHMKVVGSITDHLPETSVFPSLAAASDFFEQGSLGYSASDAEGHYDGLELRCQDWAAEPLLIESISSSFFDEPDRFPSGSVEFDCALLMRGIQHEWHSRQDLCCPVTVET